MKAKLILFAFILGISTGLYAHNVAPSFADAQAPRLEMNIYPNPTNGVFHLSIRSGDLQSYRVKVVNLIGQTIADRMVPAHEDVRFDLSGNPKGVYFLQIENGSEMIIRRIVVQ